MAILYSGTEGTCQWTIDDQGHLYIGSGVISHNTTSYDDWGWHSYRDNIVSVSSGQVTWAQGANSYGMFWRCIHATSFNLSNFDTHNNNNMMYMFGGCWSLTSLDLSGFDTSNVTNMRSMFDNCTSLTSLNLSTFNTSQVTDMYYMFVECSVLNIILVSNLWQVGQVASSYAMFGNCRQLKGGQQTSYNYNYIDKTYARIDGGPSNPGYLTDINSTSCYASFNSDTGELRIFRDVEGKYDSSGTGETIGNITYWSGIEDIEDNTEPMWHDITGDITSVNIINQFSPKTAYDMFNWCYSLTSLNLSNLNTSNITNMANMFASCTNITSLDVSHFNTVNVTNMNNMFGNCMSLISLDVSHFNTSNVTDMEGMFAGCEKLTSLDLSNFDTSKVTTMAYMFDVCEALVSLNLSSFNTSNVLLMDYMFSYCTNLTIIVISELWDTNKVTTSNKMFSNCVALKGEKNTAYNSSHLDKTYAHIDGGASNPGYLTNINSVPCYASFDSSNGELRIFRDVEGKYTNNQVIGTKTYWTGIENITGATPPKWSNVASDIYEISIVNKFYPQTAYEMFADCSIHSDFLNSLDLSLLDTSNTTNMDSMFAGCQGLLVLDLSTFNTSNVTTMSGMFVNCKNLQRLNLSQFDTSNVTEMDVMFAGCSELQNLELYVSNIPITYINIFKGVRYSNYIINALNSSATNPTKVQVATAWREIIASYSNIHYEADDLTVTFVPNPTINRETIAKLPKFVSPSLITSFVYQSNNLLPNSWHFSISKVTGHLKDYNTNYLDDTNPAASISTGTNQYSKTVNNYYFNNKTTAILSLYITIYDANDTIKESNRQTDEVESSVSGANLPMLDEDFTLDKTNRFLYQIIPNKTEVGIYAYDENHDYSGVTLPSSTTIDGQSYNVTKLNIDIHNPDGTAAVYGCFESNSLTNITSIPTPVVDLRRFLYNCQNLQKHNITYVPQSIRPIVYTDAFSNINTDIFLVNPQGVTTLNETVHEIANAFSRVHYEYTDNPEPKFDSVSIPSTRYVYDNENIKWIEDDDGIWAKITTKIILSEAFLPVGKTNAFKSIVCSVNNEIVEIRDENYSLVDANSLVSNQDKNLYIEIGTSKAITELVVIDTCDHSAIYSYTFSPLFAMLDFMPGGKGMAIGKIAERNGLDISIPTTIGEGLIPPRRQDYVETEDQVMDSTKTYYELDNDTYVVTQDVAFVSGKTYYEFVYIDNTINLSNYQLVIGKYNSVNDNALLIVGGGDNNNNRRNVLELDEAGLRVYAYDGITQLANIGYGEGQAQSGIVVAPYYTFGFRRGSIGNYSLAEGYRTIASGFASHAEGSGYAFGEVSHAEGYSLIYNSEYNSEGAHSEGYGTIAEGRGAHVEGYAPEGRWRQSGELESNLTLIRAHGDGSHAGGYVNVVDRNRVTSYTPHSEILANGMGSTAIGYILSQQSNIEHTGSNIFVINAYIRSMGKGSHAEGCIDANATGTHYILAEGDGAHAEGYIGPDGGRIIAEGNGSHAEGINTRALRLGSHAEGYSTTAQGNYSHAGGYGTIVIDAASYAIGKFNDPSNGGPLCIGNGTSTLDRSNAFTVDWDGKVECGDYSGNFKSVFNIFYPKGSYYETHLPYTINDHSYDDDNLTDADIALCGDTWFDPRVAWGGTWVLETEGLVHISAGTNYVVNGAETDTQDGGSPYIQAHTHAHTNPTISGGDHSHVIKRSQSSGSGTAKWNPTNDGTNTVMTTTGSGAHGHTVTGGGVGAVNGLPSGQTTGNAGNMPPYIVVYRWHRTA